MRPIWAAVLSVWALLALVAVLAWTRVPTPVTQPRARVVVVHTAKGAQRVLLARPAAHATTQTSGLAPATQQAVLSGQGTAIVSSPPAGGNNG